MSPAKPNRRANKSKAPMKKKLEEERAAQEAILGRQVEPGEWYFRSKDQKFRVLPAEQFQNGRMSAGRVPIEKGQPVAWGEQSEGVEPGRNTSQFKFITHNGRREWFHRSRLNPDDTLTEGGPLNIEDEDDLLSTAAGSGSGTTSAQSTAPNTRPPTPGPGFTFAAGSGSTQSQSQATELASAQEQIASLNREKVSDRNKIKAAEQKCEEEKKGLKDEIEEERRKRAEAERKAREAEAELENQRRALDRERERLLQEKEAEVTKQVKKEETCQSNLRSAEAKAQAATKERDQFKSTADELKDDIEDLKNDARNRNTRNTRALEGLQDTIKRLEEEKTAQQAEILALKRSSTVSQSGMIDNLESQLNDWKQKYEEVQTLSDGDRVRAQDCEEENQSLKAKLRERDEAITEKNLQLSKYDDELAENFEEVEKAKREHDSVSSENKRLTQEVTRLQGMVNSLNIAVRDYEKLRKESEELHNEHEQWRKQIEENGTLQNMYEALMQQYRDLEQEQTNTLDRLLELESANIGLQEMADDRRSEHNSDRSKSPAHPHQGPAAQQPPGQETGNLASQLGGLNFGEEQQDPYPGDIGDGVCPHCGCPRDDIQHFALTDDIMGVLDRETKLREQLEQATTKQAKITESLSSAYTELALAQSQRDVVQKELDLAKIRLEEADEAFTTTTEELKDAQAAKEAKEADLQQLRETHEKVMTERDNAQAQHAVGGAELAKLEAELDTARTERDGAYHSFQQQIEDAFEQRDAAQEQLDRITAERDTAEKLQTTEGSEQLRNDLKSIKAERDKLLKDLEAANDEIAQLRDDLASITDERDTTQEQQATGKEEGNRLRDQLKTITGERDRLQRQLKDLQASRDELKKSMEDGGDQGARLAAAILERNTARQQCRDLTAQLNDLQDKSNRWKTERDQFQLDLTEMTSHRDQLQLEVDASPGGRLARRTEERDAARDERDLFRDQLAAVTNERNDARRERDSACPHCGLLRTDPLGQQNNSGPRYHTNPILCWIHTYHHLWLLFLSWLHKIKSSARQLLGQSALQDRTGVLPSVPTTLFAVFIHLLVYFFLYRAYLVYAERSMWFDSNSLPIRLIQDWRRQRQAHSVIEHFFPDQSLPWPLDDIRYNLEIWLLHERSIPG